MASKQKRTSSGILRCSVTLYCLGRKVTQHAEIERSLPQVDEIDWFVLEDQLERLEHKPDGEQKKLEVKLKEAEVELVQKKAALDQARGGRVAETVKQEDVTFAQNLVDMWNDSTENKKHIVKVACILRLEIMRNKPDLTQTIRTVNPHVWIWCENPSI